MKAENPYPNKLFEYNLMKRTHEDWIRYEVFMETLNDGTLGHAGVNLKSA